MVSEMIALDSELNNASLDRRLAAVRALADMMGDGSGVVAPETDIVNMHCHSFFSFNAYGYSPSSLAWLAKRDGFRSRLGRAHRGQAGTLSVSARRE